VLSMESATTGVLQSTAAVAAILATPRILLIVFIANPPMTNP
jgi:hypothetical protein